MLVEITLRWGDDIVSVSQRHVRRGDTISAADLDMPDGPMAAVAVDVRPIALERPARRGVDWRSAASHAGSIALHALLLIIVVWHYAAYDARDVQVEALRERTLALVHDEAPEPAPIVDDVSRPAVPFDATNAKVPTAPGIRPTHTDAPRISELPPGELRRRALEEARAFGMIGLIEPASDRGAGSPWRDAEGLPGPRVDGARGPESLLGIELGGTGAGGGGTANTIGLGHVGTIGCCGGAGRAAVSALTERGRVEGHHTLASVSCRCGSTQVNGRLPPEAVQRVMRASFGRFRACYEKGLATNPSLAGRVAIKFVIDHDGSVFTADDGGSDLPDASVIQCIMRSMHSISFPAPTGGIVTVVYPLVLSSD